MTDLARGWDDAADGYERYYVPRFAPWVTAAVRALGDLPTGPVVVPCCGTFPELPELSERAPDREIIGIDLSAGMITLAQQRAAAHPGATAVQGDATTLDPRSCAAVVSVFGLQQLPDPAAALHSWAEALNPGGRLSVVYWPGATETDGPFAHLARTLGNRGDRTWEAHLIPALTSADVTVDRDEPLAFPMTHPSAAAFFDAHTNSGPLRPLANARGLEFIADLRERFLATTPTGEWRHEPRAHHLVAHRITVPASS